MPCSDHGIAGADAFQNLHLAWQTQADLGFHALRNLLAALAVQFVVDGIKAIAKMA
jgi:hypothetical protein